ncbi:MAG: NAD(P)-binding domain-containing protein [Dehalococcoidia bacterium]|jgi:NADPH-dependent F420 reductase
MNVTIIGTGKMARAIGTRMLAGGNSVTFISRQAERATALAADLAKAATRGATAQSSAATGPIRDEVVVLAVPYSAAAAVVMEYDDRLAGKIVVDITNPLRRTSEGLEPATPPGTSAAEEIAVAARPAARIVKAFNAAFASAVTAGSAGGQPLDIFIAGDDANAKATVAGVIEAGGMRPIDCGPLRHAREIEAMALLIINLRSTLETGSAMAWKLVW